MISGNVSRDRLNIAVATSPEHLRPLYAAVRDGGCNFGHVPQGVGRFKFPTGRPVIGLVSDDYDTSMGVSGFHAKSLRRFIQTCASGVIVACAPYYELYAGAAGVAVLTRQSSFIIETRPEHEIEWINFVRSVRQDLPLVIGTMKGQSEVVH